MFSVLFNLTYRLVEAEGRLATLALGLDPGLGILHADMRNRDGFVLDLIESCRPIADRHIARLIKGRTFRRMDFGEDARGVVRVLPPVSHHLAGAMPYRGLKSILPLLKTYTWDSSHSALSARSRGDIRSWDDRRTRQLPGGIERLLRRGEGGGP